MPVGTSGVFASAPPAKRRPEAAHRGGRPGEVAFARLVERRVEHRAAAPHDLLGLRRRDLPHLDEAAHVHFAHARLLVDDRVHERLREARLVALVVAVAAVAVHVDHDVFAEELAELDGQLA